MRHLANLVISSVLLAPACALDEGELALEAQGPEPSGDSQLEEGEEASGDCSDDPTCSANHEDFTVSTTDGCGTVDFIDYGPGAPGGGNNDDYFVIHDFCSDGHGVIVRGNNRWVEDGSTHPFRGYNGNGLAGEAVIYDPFKVADGTDVRPGDILTVESCLVDGRDDQTPFRCRRRVVEAADD